MRLSCVIINLTYKIHLESPKKTKTKKTNKKTFETFDFLVSFAPSYISIRHEIQGDKRIEITSSEFHFVIHQFVESSSYRFCPTLKSLCDYFRNGCAFYKM